MTDSLRVRLEPYAAAARRLEGWELDHEPERLAPGPPWDYESRARCLAFESRRVLDLGTGGAEVFSGIINGLACRAVATEEWVVNAPVAARRLRGRAEVVRASARALPFADATFDLILSRHEALCPTEIVRTLAPSGAFLTQQVIPDLWPELRAVFPDMTIFPDHFSEYQAGLAAAGLTVREAREFRRPVRFRELGHLVYHLVAAPWTIPGFGVDTHLAGLEELERRIASGDPLILTEGYYLIDARNGDGHVTTQR